MENQSVKAFAQKWLERVQGIKADESFRLAEEFIDSEEFGTDCDSLGFVMDCGHAYMEKYGKMAWTMLAIKPTREQFGEIDTLDLLGRVIYSQWRYYNRWCEEVQERFNPVFFELALERMMDFAPLED